MTDLSATLGNLLRETLRDPQGAARRLIAMNPPMEARWLGLFLVTILGLIFTRLSLLTMPAEASGEIFAVFGNPVYGFPVQAGSLVVMAAAMSLIGRFFGGEGRFADALLLVVWLQLVLTALQVVQFVALLILPPAGTMIAFGAILIFVWLLVQFTSALHGFTNAVLVFLGVVVSFVAIVTVLAILLMMLGFGPAVQGP